FFFFFFFQAEDGIRDYKVTGVQTCALPIYWPVSFRITPHWHRESVDHADITNPLPTGATTEGRLTTHGFDVGGLDILTAGTLAKNISFLLVPAAENDGSFHFEAANVRFSNLLGSSWLNIK